MSTLETLLELKQGRVKVWFACVDRPLPEIREFASVLSQEETDRARRFRAAQDRDRYIVQHGVLRSLLAGYLGCSPRQVTMCNGANGKPCLSDRYGGGSLQFSLSHSGSYAAFAFSRCGSIGVDIEEVCEIPEMEGIVEQHFTLREKAELLSGSPEDKLKAFYRIWTRKEAVLKAQGVGLLKGLGGVDVAASCGAGPWRVGVAGEAVVEEYVVADVDGPQGYCAAVAAAGNIESIAVSVDFKTVDSRHYTVKGNCHG